MSLSQGDRLGRYEVLGPIGAGGMGEVWRALDTELDRQVAIKILPESFADDPSRLERFQREAKALAALSHPNLLDIYDVGSSNGLHYAVTELLEGDTLRERITPTGLPWQKVTEIGGAVADGLAAAHGRGIVHRDLKPENLFLTADGRVKILDFGLAAVHEEAEPDAETATITEAGTVMGTPGYMAPEQVKDKQADARSDIFSLGCVIYEMASGHRAFRGETGVEVIANILKEEPPQLSSSGASVPVDLERAVHRCLEKRPEARFQSAADLSYSLKSVGLSGAAPVMATPGSGVEAPAEKNFSLAQMGMTAALLILVAVTSWWALTRSEPDEVPVEAVATSEPNRIAVVPFTNRTGDPTLDALGQRTADEIAGQLSSMEDLEVVPPSTVAAHIAERLTSSTMDPRTLVGEVAETTSAGLVFTGVVDTAGDSVELRCVLEDTVAGRVVQSFGPIVAQPNDLSPAMRTLVKEVFIATSDHLHPSLAFGAGEEWPDLETYRTFRERFRMIDRENFLPFLQLFQENPQLTRIRLSVAFSFLNGLAIRSAAEVLDSEHLEEAKLNRHQAAVTRALRLWTGGQYDVAYRLFRDELAESPGNTTLRHAAARCALFANRPATTAALYRDRVLDRAAPPGMVLLMVADAAAALHMLNDDEAAYEVLDRARVEIPSSLITDWCLLKQISLLGAMGETKRIEELLEEAIGRDFGRYEILMARINASHELRAHGYHDASVAMAEETLEFLAALCPGPPESCPVLSEFWLKALLIAGRDAEAAEMAGALEGKATGWIASRCLTGIAAARVGDTTTARNLFDRMEDLPAESDRYYNGTRAGDLKVSQAMIAAQLGDLDEALYLLRAGITGGALRVEHNLNFHELRHNVFFEPLWDHPEFQEIMRPKG